ncbi:CVNH domain-containing protein [uncultured Nostoc sp.]|uniref:CVNH domain-containing protein n=1 Tax=uncultured Nostoc sp. TaxID=340711 RepID=UPI0035CC4E9B
MSFCFFVVSASEARADGRFSNLCQRAYMTGNQTLTVYCKSSSGGESGQYLNLGRYITNNDGTLAWKSEGNYQDSCTNTFLEKDNHTIKSSCKKIDGSVVNSQLDLDKNLVVDDDGIINY